MFPNVCILLSLVERGFSSEQLLLHSRSCWILYWRDKCLGLHLKTLQRPCPQGWWNWSRDSLSGLDPSCNLMVTEISALTAGSHKSPPISGSRDCWTHLGLESSGHTVREVTMISMKGHSHLGINAASCLSAGLSSWIDSSIFFLLLLPGSPQDFTSLTLRV